MNFDLHDDRSNPAGRYILNANGDPVPEPNLIKWALWFEKSLARILCQDCYIQGDGSSVKVSTVFLGLDHNFARFSAPAAPPILWETMIFGGGQMNQYMMRYFTREEAVLGHWEAREMVAGRWRMSAKEDAK